MENAYMHRTHFNTRNNNKKMVQASQSMDLQNVCIFITQSILKLNCPFLIIMSFSQLLNLFSEMNGIHLNTKCRFQNYFFSSQRQKMKIKKEKCNSQMNQMNVHSLSFSFHVYTHSDGVMALLIPSTFDHQVIGILAFPLFQMNFKMFYLKRE